MKQNKVSSLSIYHIDTFRRNPKVSNLTFLGMFVKGKEELLRFSETKLRNLVQIDKLEEKPGGSIN